MKISSLQDHNATLKTLLGKLKETNEIIRSLQSKDRQYKGREKDN
jgi:hypothetical protein